MRTSRLTPATMIGGRIHLETSLITICTHSPELTAIPQRSQFPQPLAQAGTSSVHQPGTLGKAHFDAVALVASSDFSKSGLKIGAHYLNVSKSCQGENENRFQIE